jgi:D-glycero-alpha-D-manno-heptose-7-phosphate kinase
MIISQTPYRVSFAGGGTDLPAFYREEYGAVLSLAIDKHMYVTVSPRFEPSTRVAYTRTEIVDRVDDLQHELVREALKLTGLGRHLEITTVGDVPGGTGMGSSSTLTVGVLQAFYAYKGQLASAKNLAEQACRIEIDILGKPIGKQDQYAAAFGGLNYIRFNPDESVDVEPVPATPEIMQELSRRILLFYTEQQRDANEILKQQSDGHPRQDVGAARDAGPRRPKCAMPSAVAAASTSLPACCTKAGCSSARSASASAPARSTPGTSRRASSAPRAASCWAPVAAASCW